MPLSDIEYSVASEAPGPFTLDDEEHDIAPHGKKRDAPAPATRGERWRALLHSPWELWWVYLVKVLFSYAHFSTGIVLTLWLSAKLGLSDAQAGLAYGLSGLCATVWGVVGGAFVDRAGVWVSLQVGAVLATGARVLLALLPSRAAAFVALVLVMPLADALGIPVLTIAVKRCTGDRTAGLGFSLFYVAQNVAALAGGVAVDAVRKRVGGEHAAVAVAGHAFSYHEAVFASGAAAATACFFIVLLALRNVERGPRAVPRAEHVSISAAVARVVKQESFRRFAKLALILLGISMIYRHLDATLPKYMIRVFGENSPYGTYFALEPFIVILAVPIAGTFITCWPLYTTLIVGTFIAALSPFWLCIADKTIFVALFVFTLSIGESIYSPRVYQYTMAVSALGSEGVYSALGNAPLFAVNVVAGSMSGFLLENFVPNAERVAAGVKRRPAVLWGVIGVTCLTSPLLLALCRKYVEEPEKVDEIELEELCLASSDISSQE